MFAVDLFEAVFKFDPLFFKPGRDILDVCFERAIEVLSDDDPHGLIVSVQEARFKLNTSLLNFESRVAVKRYLIDFAAILCLYYSGDVADFIRCTYSADFDPDFSWQDELLMALGHDPEKENFKRSPE